MTEAEKECTPEHPMPNSEQEPYLWTHPHGELAGYPAQIRCRVCGYSGGGTYRFTPLPVIEQGEA